jgi:hypothetical protein
MCITREERVSVRGQRSPVYGRGAYLAAYPANLGSLPAQLPLGSLPQGLPCVEHGVAGTRARTQARHM